MYRAVAIEQIADSEEKCRFKISRLVELTKEIGRFVAFLKN